MGTTVASTTSPTAPSMVRVRGRAGPIIRTALLGVGAVAPEVIEALIKQADWCVCEQIEAPDTKNPSTFHRFDVAVLVDRDGAHSDTAEPRAGPRPRALRWLQRFDVGVLILTSRPWLFAEHGAGVVCLPPDSCVEKVHGVLLALSRSQSVLRQVSRRLASLRRLGREIHKQFEETNHELRLASRLQRDFLPREMPQEGPIRFRSLYRPCTWVSGDIFDIVRLDERHWGLYIADAVGHGLAAGLLTMYIKHAIRPKRVFEDGYELLSPSKVMSLLNDEFVRQDLPDSQFVTGWYGMINTDTLELRYAIAGHPPPMLIDAEGPIRELLGDGCLLGLQAGQRFSEESVVLRPGQRLLLYSDGLEPTLIAHRPPLPEMPTLEAGMAEMLHLPADEFITRLRDRLDTEPGSLTRADDVTVVLLEVGEQ